MSTTAYKQGDSVRFIGAELHRASPDYYPSPGTRGIYQGGGWVQWPKGSTGGNDRWHAPASALKRGVGIKTCRLFTPHLVMYGETVGALGTPTRFRDFLGRSLVVGDIVEIFNSSNSSYSDNVVCDDGAQYVMGIKSACNERAGTTGYWKLLKKRGFDEVRHGECVDGVTYVKNKKGCGDMLNRNIPEPSVDPPEDFSCAAGCGHEVYEGEKLIGWHDGRQYKLICEDCFRENVAVLTAEELARLVGCECRTVITAKSR